VEVIPVLMMTLFAALITEHVVRVILQLAVIMVAVMSMKLVVMSFAVMPMKLVVVRIWGAAVQLFQSVARLNLVVRKLSVAGLVEPAACGLRSIPLSMSLSAVIQKQATSAVEEFVVKLILERCVVHQMTLIKDLFAVHLDQDVVMERAMMQILLHVADQIIIAII